MTHYKDTRHWTQTKVSAFGHHSGCVGVLLNLIHTLVLKAKISMCLSPLRTEKQSGKLPRIVFAASRISKISSSVSVPVQDQREDHSANFN